MLDKEKQDLRARYKNLDDEELIKITTIDRNDYLPEAVELASLELAKRNIDIKQQTEKAETIAQQRKLEKRETEERLLTKRQRFFFVLFPGISFYYSIFAPKDWEKRRKEATKLYYKGLLLWVGFFILLLIILMLIKRSRS